MAIRGFSCLMLGLWTVALPAIAGAQPAAASAAALAWSKSDAILGGPSALQSILAKQRASTPSALAPASYSVPVLTRAVVRTDDGVLSGRPDVFGTVALKVAHTSLDARWRAVENRKLTGEPARFAAALRKADAGEQLKLANRYVNSRVHYVDDQRRFGRPDVWSAANDTLRSGRGDCEDYAIAKFQLLRAAGFSERNLYLVIVRDLVRRADHAVLVARSDGHMYVLDNGTDEVLESGQVSDYRPVLTFASYGEWTHGYRVDVPTNVALADGQRSRSASLLALSAGLSK